MGKKRGQGKKTPIAPFEEKVLMRATAMKAKMRASLWAITYQKETMEMPDIRATMRLGKRRFQKTQARLRRSSPRAISGFPQKFSKRPELFR